MSSVVRSFGPRSKDEEFESGILIRASSLHDLLQLSLQNKSIDYIRCVESVTKFLSKKILYQ